MCVVAQKVLITRPAPGSGVGSNLASLIGAVHLARKIGADLAVDWTNLDELRNKELNAFERFFRTPEALAGVRILKPTMGAFPDRVRIPVTDKNLRILASGDGPPVAELSRYHGLDRLRALAPDILTAKDVEVEFERSIYLQIDPSERIQRKIDEWMADHTIGKFLVGVNVRMGNGLFDKGTQYHLRVNTRIFASRNRFLEGVERGVTGLTGGLPEAARAAVRVYFAADTRRMYEWMKDCPGYLTRRTKFPPDGVGHVFADYADPDHDDIAAFEDIVFDMYALARCDALIYNGTNFNRLARYRTKFFSGNMANIERFFPLLRFVHQAECRLRTLKDRLVSGNP